MSVPTVALSEATPAGSSKVREVDDRIREYKIQNREIMDVDHNYPSSGTDDDAGKHNQVSFIEAADIGTGAEGLPILGAQTVSGKAELVFTDEDDNDVQLTSSGKLMLDSGRIANDSFITARNNADDDDVNILKVDTSDIITFASFPVTPSEAPDADYEVSNKKYVDDTVKTIGSWVSKSNNTAYEATTAGFVIAYATGAHTLKGYTDASNPPTTLRCSARDQGDDADDSDSTITMPVKSGDYWKVTGAGTVYWIPLS